MAEHVNVAVAAVQADATNNSGVGVGVQQSAVPFAANITLISAAQESFVAQERDIEKDPTIIGEELRNVFTNSFQPSEILGPVNIIGHTSHLYRALVEFMASRQLFLPQVSSGRAVQQIAEHLFVREDDKVDAKYYNESCSRCSRHIEPVEHQLAPKRDSSGITFTSKFCHRASGKTGSVDAHAI
jgi:hypothetical protein